MNYQTERNSQGHLVIREVPIFMDCQRGDLVFDREWVEKAVELARQAADDHYFPPLHVAHHGMGDEVTAAGFFEITHAGPIMFRGGQRLAVFADLTITNEEVEQDVVMQRLPYRSVEILKPSQAPSIDSLALLDHAPPYLQFAMLKVEGVEPRTASEQQFALANIAGSYGEHASQEADGMLVCMQQGDRTALLFDPTQEVTMAATGKKKPTKTAPAPKKPAAAVAMADGEAPEQKGDEPEAMESDGLDIATICEAIKSGTISVADMDAIMEAIMGQKQPEEVADDPTAVQANVPGAAMSADDSVRMTQLEQSNADLTKQVAKLQAKVDAGEAKVQAAEAEAQRDRDVAAAMTRLEGKPLGSDLEGRLTKFHDSYGAEAFTAYTDELEASFAALDGDTPPGADPKTKTPTSKEVEPYAQFGPEAFTSAEQFSAQWRQMHSAGHTSASESEFIAYKMQREHGVQLA